MSHSRDALIKAAYERQKHRTTLPVGLSPELANLATFAALSSNKDLEVALRNLKKRPKR